MTPSSGTDEPLRTAASRGPARPGTGHLPPLPARTDHLGRSRSELPFAWLPWVLLTVLLVVVALMLAVGSSVGDDADAVAGRLLPVLDLPERSR